MEISGKERKRESHEGEGAGRSTSSQSLHLLCSSRPAQHPSFPPQPYGVARRTCFADRLLGELPVRRRGWGETPTKECEEERSGGRSLERSEERFGAERRGKRGVEMIAGGR